MIASLPYMGEKQNRHAQSVVWLHLAEALVEGMEERAAHGDEIGLKGTAQTNLRATKEVDIVEVDNERLVTLLEDRT